MIELKNNTDKNEKIKLDDVKNFVDTHEKFSDYYDRNIAFVDKKDANLKGILSRMISVYSLATEVSMRDQIKAYLLNLDGVKNMKFFKDSSGQYHLKSQEFGDITFLRVNELLHDKFNQFIFNLICINNETSALRIIAKTKRPQDYSFATGLIDVFQWTDADSENKGWISWLETEKSVINPVLRFAMPKEQFYNLFNVQVLNRIAGKDIKSDYETMGLRNFIISGDSRYILCRDEVVEKLGLGTSQWGE